MSLDDFPTIPEGTNLSNWKLIELRSLFRQYADLEPQYDDAFNDAFKAFITQESTYIRVYGKVAVLDEIRQTFLSEAPEALVTGGEESLAQTLQAIGITAGATALTKLLLLGKTGKELYGTSKLVGAADELVELGSRGIAGIGRGARQMVHGHNVEKAKLLSNQQKALRTKALLGTIGVVSAGVLVYLQVKGNKELKADLVEALPLYQTWFQDTSALIDTLEAETLRMQNEVQTIVNETSTGTVDNLLTYLDAALGSAGQFKALFESAVAMLEDNISEEKVSEYTGLPLSYVQQIAGQI